MKDGYIFGDAWIKIERLGSLEGCMIWDMRSRITVPLAAFLSDHWPRKLATDH